MSIEHGPQPEDMHEMEFQASPDQGKEINFFDEAYAGSVLLQKAAVQEQRGEEFTAAFTDIDNTYYRGDRVEQSKRLGEKAESLSYPLICVTGNDFNGVMNRINNDELHAFDIIIGSVGTEIWVRQSLTNDYKKDVLFENKLLDSGFDRAVIAGRASQLLKEAKANTDLQYQNPEVETDFIQTGNTENVQPFKVSFHFFADGEDQLKSVTELAASFFPSQELVVCEEINHNSRLQSHETRKKYCLDIVPITKAGAVRYVSDLIGVKKGIVAGDSGNDTDMLVNSGGLAAVIVGGAKSELLNAVANETGQEAKTNFTRVIDEEGRIKAYYVERKANRLGPDSIAHASEVLLRAERIQQIRDSAGPKQ